MAKPIISGLDGLQSSEHLQLLDVIDRLRAEGLSSLFPLPQLIVCGDQSSGKSSVLAAISGIPFPKKDNLCTRFATEVILRRDGMENRVTVSINPGQDRSETSRQQLLGFTYLIEDISELPTIIEQAKVAMGLGSLGNAFSTDVLRLEVIGPTMPQLTIVDLPGLIHSENKMQTAQDIELVTMLVERYMSEPRSIILAVISAKNDYANQIVLKRARIVDPFGKRTLGIITKPDTLHHSSESELAFLGLAKNLDINFQLGWHVVRNLDSNADIQVGNSRDLLEQDFFQKSNWKSLDPASLGVQMLRTRLSQVLFDQIRTELPGLIQQIEDGVKDCEQELVKLGKGRTTEDEQMTYLVELSQEFQKICKAGCDGNYDVDFFGAATSDNASKRLRAIVQNESEAFAEVLRTKGARWRVVEGDSTEDNCLTKKDAVNRVVDLLKRSRGRELPGTFNPLTIGELFRDYSTPWSDLAREHVHHIWKRCELFVDLILQSLSDSHVSDALGRLVLNPALRKLLASAETRLNGILSDLKSHPITYNHYFTETVANIQHDRHAGEMKRLLIACFKEKSSMHMSDIDWLLSRLTPHDIDPNMSRTAAETTLDYMNAYYKTALKRFLDDIPVQILEAEIVSQLPSILLPSMMSKLNKELIYQIAGESESKITHRNQLESRLRILRTSEETCRTNISRDLQVQSHQYDSKRICTSLSEESPRTPVSDLSIITTPHPPLASEQMKTTPSAFPFEFREADTEREIGIDLWGYSESRKSKGKKTKGITSLWPPDE